MLACHQLIHKAMGKYVDYNIHNMMWWVLTYLDAVINVLKEDASGLDELDVDMAVVLPEKAIEMLKYVRFNEMTIILLSLLIVR